MAAAADKGEAEGRPEAGRVARGFARLGLAGLGPWQGAPVAFLVLLVFIGLRSAEPDQFTWLRLGQFDLLQRLSPRQFEQDPVVIIDIDEKSLKTFGQWPWPRFRMAELIKTVAAAKPLAIGLDIIFAEPDRLSPENVTANLPKLPEAARRAIAGLPSNDDLFADSLKGVPVVLGIAAIEQESSGESSAGRPKSNYFLRGDDPAGGFKAYRGFLRNLPVITARAAGEGVLNSVSDADGIVRRLPLLAAVDGKLYPSLALELLRVAYGEDFFVVHSDKAGVTGISIADFLYPTTADGQVWLHYTRHRPARFVSAADLLQGSLPPATLAGRLVLVGTSSTGPADLRATPLEPTMAGVEIHAQLLEMMAAGHALIRPAFAALAEMALILVAGLLIIAFVPLLRPTLSPLPFLIVIACLAITTWFAFSLKFWLLDSSQPMLAALAVFAVMSASTWASADTERRQLAFDLGLERAQAARIQGELEAARQIQMGILPSDFPAYPERDDFEIFARLEPARLVGGDLYDFALMDGNQLFFMVGDVSGKGVPASLFMALSKALYKSGALRHRRDIARIMAEANNEICRENPEMLFVTVLAGILDLGSGELEWCNAGHDTPYLLRMGEAPRLVEIAGGPPLGIIEDFDYQASRLSLESGDYVVASSDGVSEAMSAGGEMFSADRVSGALAAHQHDWGARVLVDQLFDAVSRFAEGIEPSDDITILALQYTGPISGSGSGALNVVPNEP